MHGRLPPRLLVLFAAVATCAAIVSASATAQRAAASERTAAGPGLKSGVVVAKRHVVRRHRIRGLYSVRAKRSRRTRAFAVVTGYYRRPARPANLWVVYLRVRDGRWRIAFSAIGARAIEPRVRVPCDIWPPFSEPAC